MGRRYERAERRPPSLFHSAVINAESANHDAAACMFMTRVTRESNWKAAVRSGLRRSRDGSGFTSRSFPQKIDSLKNIYDTRVISKGPLTIYENIDLTNKGLFK